LAYIQKIIASKISSIAVGISSKLGYRNEELE